MAEHIGTPAQRLLAMTLGVAHTQALRAAAELRVADLLAGGPRTASDLAEATGANLDALTRLLRVLTHLGVTAEVSPGAYRATELGALLRSDSPDSLRHYALLMAQDCFAAAWPRLGQSVRTGESGFAEVHGQTVYGYFHDRPDVGAVMNQAMSELTRKEGLAIRDAYDFASHRLVVDVGGGRGGLVAAVLSGYPALRGLLYDQPHVVAEAAGVLVAHGVADRCEVRGGDFLSAVPVGGDLYLVKRILIDQADDPAVKLLGNIRAAIEPDGRLLVADPDPGTGYGLGLDMFMLMVFGGKLRTEAEVSALFERTGFRFVRSIDTDSAVRLIEAVPT